MKPQLLIAALAATLSMGCAASRTFDLGRWNQEGVCKAVTQSLEECNYRVETREIHSPPVERKFRARFIGVRHEMMSDTFCSVKIRPLQKLGRYRFDVCVDEENPFLLGFPQRLKREEERLIKNLMTRLGAMTILPGNRPIPAPPPPKKP